MHHERAFNTEELCSSLNCGNQFEERQKKCIGCGEAIHRSTGVRAHQGGDGIPPPTTASGQARAQLCWKCVCALRRRSSAWMSRKDTMFVRVSGVFCFVVPCGSTFRGTRVMSELARACHVLCFHVVSNQMEVRSGLSVRCRVWLGLVRPAWCFSVSWDLLCNCSCRHWKFFSLRRRGPSMGRR